MTMNVALDVGMVSRHIEWRIAWGERGRRGPIPPLNFIEVNPTSLATENFITPSLQPQVFP